METLSLYDRPLIGKSEIIMLGSGSSTGVPWLQCLTQRLNSESEVTCEVCKEATSDKHAKNRRRNPSLLIRHLRPNETFANVVIDVGKTFRDSVESFFPPLGVRHIDAIMLTHDHADAILGLDDLRDIQPHETVKCEVSGNFNVKCTNKIQLFGCKKTIQRLYSVYRYLFPSVLSHELHKILHGESSTFLSVNNLPPPLHLPSHRRNESNSTTNTPTLGLDPSPLVVLDDTDKAALEGRADRTFAETKAIQKVSHDSAKEENKQCTTLSTYIAALDILPFESWKIFEVQEGLHVLSFPVLHGVNYYCNCFELGYHAIEGHMNEERDRVVYISDVSKIEEEVMNYLKSGKRVDVLVIDCVMWNRSHATHFGKEDTLAAIREIRPRRAVFTGMCHQINYHVHNSELGMISSDLGIEIELGYDGLRIPVVI